MSLVRPQRTLRAVGLKQDLGWAAEGHVRWTGDRLVFFGDQLLEFIVAGLQVALACDPHLCATLQAAQFSSGLLELQSLDAAVAQAMHTAHAGTKGQASWQRIKLTP